MRYNFTRVPDWMGVCGNNIFLCRSWINKIRVVYLFRIIIEHKQHNILRQRHATRPYHLTHSHLKHVKCVNELVSECLNMQEKKIK